MRSPRIVLEGNGDGGRRNSSEVVVVVAVSDAHVVADRGPGLAPERAAANDGPSRSLVEVDADMHRPEPAVLDHVVDARGSAEGGVRPLGIDPAAHIGPDLQALEGRTGCEVLDVDADGSAVDDGVADSRPEVGRAGPDAGHCAASGPHASNVSGAAQPYARLGCAVRGPGNGSRDPGDVDVRERERRA